MFDFLKKKRKEPPKPDFSEIREMLFADVPLAQWGIAPAPQEQSGPWRAFADARAALESGDESSAVTALRTVVDGSVGSRQLLQAWHFLRQLGVHPQPEVGKHVLGVVLEIQMPGGLDTLAAYADHTARYINHGGNLLIWEAAAPDISRLIDALLQAGQTVVDVIGPADEPRRGPPPKDNVRLNMLTPSGLHFGEGAWSAFAKDALGGPVLSAGAGLMTALIERAGAQSGIAPVSWTV